MDNRIAFVAAGCSGAGKSTLLRKAFRRNIPIFGSELSPRFQAVNPLYLPERHKFDEALREKTVFQAKHLPNLLALTEPPHPLVVHLDILNILLKLSNDPVFLDAMPAMLRMLQPRAPDALICRETNRQVFQHYLKIAFERYDVVVVNTLYAPYEKNLAQWHAKKDEIRTSTPIILCLTSTIRVPMFMRQCTPPGMMR